MNETPLQLLFGDIYDSRTGKNVQNTLKTQTIIILIISAALSLFALGAFAQEGSGKAPPSLMIPLPDPIPRSFDPNNPLNFEPPADENPVRNPAQSQTGFGDADQKIEILYDVEELPFAVRRMRELIMDAARSGDPEKLRTLIGNGANITRLSLTDIEGDPITYLQSVSGDKDGHEILAILLEVMEAGFTRLDGGTDNELYVWPYFYAIPLQDLTPPQRVELFKLVTAGDYEDMVSFGAYIFFRVGITPEGRWLFFVAGD